MTVPRQIGGNTNLRPEIGQNFTAGASYSPGGVPGLSLSADYYDINISNVIVAPPAQDVVTRCFRGQLALCGQVQRNPATNAITRVNTTFTNFSNLVTRGIDFELPYRLPLSKVNAGADGALRFRFLGNHTFTRASNDGIVTLETAGTVGDSFNGIPRWRAVASVAYEGTTTVLDARLRFVGGGLYNAASDISNNRIKGNAYIDLGAQVKAGPLLIRGSIVNLMDVDPPLTTYGQIFYDQVGRQFNVSATVRL